METTAMYKYTITGITCFFAGMLLGRSTGGRPTVVQDSHVMYKQAYEAGVKSVQKQTAKHTVKTVVIKGDTKTVVVETKEQTVEASVEKVETVKQEVVKNEIVSLKATRFVLLGYGLSHLITIGGGLHLTDNIAVYSTVSTKVFDLKAFSFSIGVQYNF